MKEKVILLRLAKEVRQYQNSVNKNASATEVKITRKNISNVWFLRDVEKILGESLTVEEILIVIDTLITKDLVKKELVEKTVKSEYNKTGKSTIHGQTVWKKRKEPITTNYKEWEYNLTDKAIQYLETLRNNSE